MSVVSGMMQLALFDVDMYSSVSYSRDDFIELDSNSDALVLINGWPGCWMDNSLLIVGPRHSGKTHLARMWQEKARAVLILPGTLVSEGGLFSVIEQHDSFVLDLSHDLSGYDSGSIELGVLRLFNMARERQSWLLIAACSEWVAGIKLKDLKSRMLAMQSVKVEGGELSDIQVSLILCKLMSDYQLSLTRKQYSFIVARMPRSLLAVQRFCALASQHVAQRQCKLTRGELQKILSQLGSDYDAGA